MTPAMEMKLAKIARANNSGRNIIFVDRFDDYVQYYLDARHAILIKNNAIEKLYEIEGRLWSLVLLTESSKGCRPRKVMIDKRIDDDIIETVLYHKLYLCDYIEVF